MALSPNSTEIKIRKAVVSDIQQVYRLLKGYGDKGMLLARPLSELYDHLRDFSILVDEKEREPIVGVCALGICWDGLAEIRSLAVVESHQGKGYGAWLVRTCLREAADLGIGTVFALTYVERFFLSLGFRKVEKSVLPHKIWGDCLRCSKYPDCDETAVLVDLPARVTTEE